MTFQQMAEVQNRRLVGTYILETTVWKEYASWVNG